MLPCQSYCKYPHTTWRFHWTCLCTCRTKQYAYGKLKNYHWNKTFGVPMTDNPAQREIRVLTALTPYGKQTIFSTPVGQLPDLRGAFVNYTLIIDRKRCVGVRRVCFELTWRLAEKINDLFEQNYYNPIVRLLRRRTANLLELLA
jgi:hypothetical protein